MLLFYFPIFIVIKNGLPTHLILVDFVAVRQVSYQTNEVPLESINRALCMRRIGEVVQALVGGCQGWIVRRVFP